MVIQGREDRCSSVFFRRVFILLALRKSAAFRGLKMTLKISYDAYFQPAYVSVVITFTLFLRIPAAVRSTSAYPFDLNGF